MLFEWIWKNRTTTDEKMLNIMDRIAVAAEKQALAAELSHKATVESAKSAVAANAAARKKYKAELLLVEEERDRRKALDKKYSST